MSKALSRPPRGNVAAHTVHDFRRRVVVGGQDLGMVAITFGTEDKPGTELWARPYFDPVAKELRIQASDGLDVGYSKTLFKCAACKYLRPFLYLACSEGLLEKIPGVCIFFGRQFVTRLLMIGRGRRISPVSPVYAHPRQWLRSPRLGGEKRAKDDNGPIKTSSTDR